MAARSRSAGVRFHGPRQSSREDCHPRRRPRRPRDRLRAHELSRLAISLRDHRVPAGLSPRRQMRQLPASRAHDRIEEHGVHVWMGVYENAFRMIRRCYEELYRAAGQPLATRREAFAPQDDFTLEEQTDAGWVHWPVRYPPNQRLPGDGDALFLSAAEYARMTLSFLGDALRDPASKGPSARAIAGSAGVATALLAAARPPERGCPGSPRRGPHAGHWRGRSHPRPRPRRRLGTSPAHPGRARDGGGARDHRRRADRARLLDDRRRGSRRLAASPRGFVDSGGVADRARLLRSRDRLRRR